MAKRWWVILLVTVLLGASVSHAQEPEQSPEIVVEDFYGWYLDFIGTGEDFRNPLSERAYRDSALLTERFVSAVDEMLESPQGPGYDPFLQAQDVPTWIQVGSAEIAEDGQSAVVTVYTSFPKHVLSVSVVQEDDRWLIDDVARGELATPEDVATSFYTRYLGWGTPADEHFVNPMVAKTYQLDPLLTEEYIAEIDALLASWEAEYGGYMADPFLCAQDIPTTFTVEEARYREDGQTADVVVRTSFANHALTLDLVQRDGEWLIDGITCGETRTPTGVVTSFYDWYREYTWPDAEGNRANVLVDGAYRDHALLTADFIARVDEALASMTGSGYDPFLCAQDIPAMVRVTDVLEETDDSARVAVETSFEGHTFEVALKLVDGTWQIDGILCQ